MEEETPFEGLRQNYRIYPDAEQTRALYQWSDSLKECWNHFLQLNMDLYETHKVFCFYGPNKNKLMPHHEGMSKLIKGYKKSNPDMYKPHSMAIQNILRLLDQKLRGQKKSNKNKQGFPKFKDRHSRVMICINQNNIGKECSRHIRVEKDRILIPKLGWVKSRVHRDLSQHLLKSINIVRDGNQWYVSCLHMRSRHKHESNGVIGIDLGLKELAVTSDGEVFTTPKYYRKAQKRLAKAQRHAARKQKGSRRQTKAKLKVQKIHRHVRNQRKDYLHKISTKIAKRYGRVYLETLNIAGWKKNRRLAKSTSDQGLAIFIQMLKYKTDVYPIDRWTPSSKMCSRCGHMHPNLTLSDRSYICDVCGLVLDRDENAAHNILNEGLRQFKHGQGLSITSVKEPKGSCGEDNLPANAADSISQQDYLVGENSDLKIRGSSQQQFTSHPLW